MKQETDLLQNAALTSEERKVWEATRAELAKTRSRLALCEALLSDIESRDSGIILTRPDFNREVARMLACDERYGGVSSLVYFDIDGLEQVIEKYGQPMFEKVTEKVGHTLGGHVRRCDVVGQLGPAEFGVLLLRCNNEDAWRKAEGLTAALEEELAKISGMEVSLSISYGAYTFKDAEDLASGISKAAESTKGK